MNAVLATESRDWLRQTALARRQALSAAQAQRWSERIQPRALALPSFGGARAVALYSPIHNEVDTASLLDHGLARGKRVFLPRWNGSGFAFAQITRPDELVPGRFGIAEPVSALGLTVADRRELLVFVPGVVFDGQGHRLGRGSGSYDRLLDPYRGSVTAVGLAYEFQVVDAVPAQSWDFAMDFIVTEERTIDCLSARRQAGAVEVDGELRREVH